MQNKANFRKSQMNVTPYNTKDYVNKRDRTFGENKPNSNPIKPNSNPNKAKVKIGKMNISLAIIKDYDKNN